MYVWTYSLRNGRFDLIEANQGLEHLDHIHQRLAADFAFIALADFSEQETRVLAHQGVKGIGPSYDLGPLLQLHNLLLGVQVRREVS